MFGSATHEPVGASIGDRIVANIIDGAVMWVILIPFYLVTMVFDRGSRSGSPGLLSSLILLVGLAAMIAYYPVFIGRTGRTIGKNVMAIEVQDVRTGAPIGIGRAIVRWLVHGLMGSICYLGYISIFVDQSGYHRGWHDKAADDRVVKTGTKIPFGRLLKLQR